MTRTLSPSLVAANPLTFEPLAVERGFTLVEFLISCMIVLIISAPVFAIFVQAQRTASYQAEVQEVLDNTLMALEIIQRILQQAGNDPYRAGFPAITIVSPSEVRVCSDLTGSAGSGSPDKGDPDGDIDDANEDITIRFVAGDQSIELVPAGGSAQSIVSGISAFSLQYFDRNGNLTNAGGDVTLIRVSITGTSAHPDPQTGKVFSMKVDSDIRIIGAPDTRPFGT